MGLFKFIVQRKILISLIVVLVLMVGSFAIVKLDKELMPSVNMDGAFVEINAGEMAAIEVERTITTPLEQKIQGIDGVEDIKTTTLIGRSTFMITLERGRGEELFKEIEALVNSTTSDISGIEDVMAMQYGTSQSYELFMDVSGGEMEKMTAFSKNILEPRLEALPEVRDVDLSGIQEHEMSIVFNRGEMTKKGLDPSQVIAAIQQTDTESTIGEFSNDKGSPSVRWSTKLATIDDVKNIQIPTQNGFIELDEIANVSLDPIESSSFAWKNGTKDFVLVQVGRNSDYTQIEMTEAVREELKDIRDEDLIKGFDVNEIVAQSDYVKESIDGVTSNIIIGAVIAFAILLIFLRNIRATIIVGISIPTSVLLTFSTMWLLDYSFNMLTLIGLGLGIGMMVDSSIVILESIYRKKEQGLSKLDAVLEGTKEVSSAVIASMLTTIVVFLPIGMLGGDMGQFMIMLSVVVAITLISSVIISFTLIPSLSEKFLKIREQKKARKEGRFIRGYRKLISWIVRKKRYSIAVITIFFLMFVGSLLLVTKIPMTIMPDMFNRYTEVAIDIESGISLEEKEEMVQEINHSLKSVHDVESNYVLDNGTSLYTIINMTKGDDITTGQKEVNEDISKALRNLKETQPIEAVQSAMAGGGSPVQVNIKGESFEELKVISDQFINELKGIEGIVGVTNTMERTSVEQVIELKAKEIEKAGLSQSQIKQFMEQAFLQMQVSEMNVNDESVPLMVKWDKKTDTQSALLDLMVPTPKGEKKLSTFISLNSVDTPNEITHTDGERFISISADIEGRDLGAINRDVQRVIDEFDTPTGYTVSVAGDLEQQQELIQEMIIILAIAIFLVYLVMAVQFNHLGHPLIVMSVIPMTLVGVILGLFMTQRDLSIMSGMGIVMLIGIVLNNAILLIDRTNQLRKEGNSIQDALVEAGKNRIRPIFMTTLTTVGGMLPLALATGSSGNYQAPMATAIIGGLLFATIITLFLIPAVYRLFSKKTKVRTEIESEFAESNIEVSKKSKVVI
ncbi:HAE1 family hydrophobic/amphiphilic exporter-1 [Bacillus pakistanensis]|uniref:HAE1 family hydrophobic/amphiphilic exporter-1 n=1 Tax=Rossellomorea pakistanensis TaxID=992288 RepID=A0ABS2NGX3_9BACI|nr:efflux RND transporter permease subunit [Bacillus pakistanensis]MBM7587106.1 HAE1 family hydrophobic/amphiphilic exporter-1 [Bacillus pakistanensis]